MKKLPADEPLEALLRQEEERLEQESLRLARAGEPVPASHLENLDRLARLVELRRRLGRGEAPGRRWPAAVVMALTLLLASILWFWRIGETEIELDLVVTEARFSSPSEQVLSEFVPLAFLGVSRAQRISLPRSGGLGESTLDSSSEAAPRLSISLPSSGDGAGELALTDARLQPGTRIGIELSPVSRRYRLSLSNAPVTLNAAVAGRLSVASSAALPDVRDFRSPKSARIIASENGIDLDLELPPGARRELARQLAATDLVFSRIDRHVNEGSTLVREASTVLAGKLYLEELGGKTLVMRPGEHLRFQHSEGVLRSLKLLDDGVALEFHGRVRGMTVGSEYSPRSLMPTLLEWLKARHGLALLWSTAIYLAGVAGGLLRWLKWQT